MPSIEGGLRSRTPEQKLPQSLLGIYKATDKIITSWARTLPKHEIVGRRFDIGIVNPERQWSRSILLESDQTRVFLSLDDTQRIKRGFRIESKEWRYFLEGGLLDSNEMWLVAKNDSGKNIDLIFDLDDSSAIEEIRQPEIGQLLGEVFGQMNLPREDLETLKEIYKICEERPTLSPVAA